MKNKMYVISHTHWDREWYMSFESHRMKLVKLMDTLIEKLEAGDGYEYFHLDGQTIIVEDYLEIRPQMRERLFRLIKLGKIQVGPWYILQDEFLTSGEANIRNMLEGLRFCKENGIEPVMSGYMPDAFGNIGQLPQILDGFGIDNAIFGRGRWPIWFDNKIEEGKNPAERELIWHGADGTEIMGIMFGDWYNNANELPTDKEGIIQKYNELIKWLEITAKTPHLLGMNGCDHQPVQTNLPESIKKANEIFGDEIEIKHSNFKEFISLMREYKDGFTDVYGELISQNTDGLTTLVDTASTHINMKQKNHSVQNMLAFKSEPVNVMSMLCGDKYRADELRYAWKELMKCHPHDSICCCSCDAVPKEMDVRFDKANDVGVYVLDEAMEYMASCVDTSDKGENNIIVFHSAPITTSHIVDTRVYFNDFVEIDSLALRDFNGELIPSVFEYEGEKFTYTLPKDKFRQVEYRHCYKLRFPVKLSGIGFFCYTVEINKKNEFSNNIKVFENGAENEHLSFIINPNGTIDITEKQSGRKYSGFNQYEDSGDYGDSYIYRQTKDLKSIYSDKAEVNLIENNALGITYEVISEINIPEGLAEKDNRSDDMINHKIKTYITLSANDSRLDIKTVFTNKSENHRLRTIFPTRINTKTVLADGQFDVTKRDITPWEGWKNPNNTQRMQAFFGLEDENGGVLIAGRGLNEYEVLRDGKNTMALTLLRAIGEVGDWGYFPTPSMQMIDKELTLCYSIIPYTADNRQKAFNEAYTFAGDYIACVQTDCHKGDITPNKTFVTVKGEYITFSAFKKSEQENNALLRIYNVSGAVQTAEIIVDTEIFDNAFLVNFNETNKEKLSLKDGKAILKIEPKKIISILLNKI